MSIWDDTKGQWISKEDTGTESNTEAKKGLASDSFKRACVNWGIGRELYTAPFIWIPAGNYTANGRKCYDKFSVEKIEYVKNDDGSDRHEILNLSIRNTTMNKRVFVHIGSTAKKGSK